MIEAAQKERVVGWREWVALPDLEVERIKAKVDTGARTSAIHAFGIREMTRDGRPHVEFYLHPVQRLRRPQIKCLAPIFDQRYVRSSSGERQYRYIIRTTLRIGHRRRLIELSLAQRDQMGFRLLIGRNALPRGLLVDPNKSFLVSYGGLANASRRLKAQQEKSV
ncbi:MAG: RimK/LysX family protein [Rhodovibrionaceae bacterium]